jgi:hypothetical protein
VFRNELFASDLYPTQCLTPDEENKNAEKTQIVSTQETFENFSLQPTIGYYRGRPENSIVIEIVGAKGQQIMQVALILLFGLVFNSLSQDQRPFDASRRARQLSHRNKRG